MRRSPATTGSEDVSLSWPRASRMAAVGFIYAGAALPVAWLLAFYAFIVRVRVVAGAWPTSAGGVGHYAFPFFQHALLVSVGSFLLPLCFVSWCVASGGFVLVARRLLSLRRFFGLLGIWLAAGALVLVDPGGFFSWFFLYSD